MCMFMHACEYARMHACTHVCIYVYVCSERETERHKDRGRDREHADLAFRQQGIPAGTHTYTHTHTHTHAHTHTHTPCILTPKNRGGNIQRTRRDQSGEDSPVLTYAHINHQSPNTNEIYKLCTQKSYRSIWRGFLCANK